VFEIFTWSLSIVIPWLLCILNIGKHLCLPSFGLLRPLCLPPLPPSASFSLLQPPSASFILQPPSASFSLLQPPSAILQPPSASFSLLQPSFSLLQPPSASFSLLQPPAFPISFSPFILPPSTPRSSYLIAQAKSSGICSRVAVSSVPTVIDHFSGSISSSCLLANLTTGQRRPPGYKKK
jgi:hypothetical protein